MTWEQTYTPTGGVLGSALLGAVPVIVLLGCLGVLHVAAHRAALFGLVAALLVATLGFGMPVPLALAAAGAGAAYGLFPISWIVLNAIFLYDITVHTGQFDILKRTIANLADDRRVQALLIAFSFGAFIEGAAGFGTPVAVSAAMLIGLGFAPLQAAGLALIGNTAPVAFGALGTPLVTLAGVTGLPLLKLSAMVGRQLPVFSAIVPFWMIAAMTGLRGLRDVWPACLVVGLSFGTAQFLLSNFHGPWLVDVVGAIVSMVSLVLFLRVWRPRTTWRFAAEGGEVANGPAPTRGESARAWMPWGLLSIFVFTWGVPVVKDSLNKIFAPKLAIPLLHKAVIRMPPVVPKPEPEAAMWSANFLSAAGTALLLAALISGIALGIRPLMLLRMWGRTLLRVRLSILTIVAMIALGFTTRYSGSDTTMGLAFASTGRAFPFFSAMLGWLGVALTGSDTSSNVLFGNLQKVTAERLGLPPLLTAAANSSGGVMGKMIDAQSIVVAGVATGEGSASAGRILRYVFLHSLALATLVGLLVLLQAYVFPWVVPQ